MQFLMGLYARFVRGMRGLESPLLLAIRLYWGWQFAQTGWGKLHRLDQVAEFFQTLNLPAPHFTAVFCATVEFAGGILLALGLGSRLVSLVLFVNMTVAYWTADREAFGQILSNPDKFTGADPYHYWFAALLILILGPGLFALDTLLRRRFAALESKPAVQRPGAAASGL